MIVETELEKCGRDKESEYNCCLVCNMRNLHRAVNTNNPQLLEQLVLDKKHIANMLNGWSKSDKTTIMDKIIMKNSPELLQALFPSKVWTKGSKSKVGGLMGIQQDPIIGFYGPDRVSQKDYLIHKIDTGYVSNKAYHARVRQVNVTRGNR